MFLSNRIRVRRMELGMTELFVATMLMISRPTLRSWENGVTFPPADELECLVALLNDDVRNYFDGKSDSGEDLREVVRR